MSGEKLTDRTTQVMRIVSPRRSGAAMALKRLLQGIAFVAVLPRLLIYGVASLALGKERAFANASEGIGRVPGIRGVYQRQAFYRATLAGCGRDVYFGWLCTFSTPMAEVGEEVYIGRRCGLGLVKLGLGVMLADGVQVLSGAHQHGTESATAYREQAQEYRRVSIGDGAWVGADAVVMADVGAGAVIGAGAVVNRPIGPRTVAAGVPATVIRRIGEDGGPTA